MRQRRISLWLRVPPPALLEGFCAKGAARYKKTGAVKTTTPYSFIILNHPTNMSFF